MSDLPPGFQLDEPPQGLVINMNRRPPVDDIPAGFVLDDSRSPLQEADRKLGIGVQGVTRSLYNTVAAPFDLAAAVTNATGLSSGPSWIGEKIRGAPTAMVQALGRDKIVPENRTEKTVEGVGEGIGSVLSTMLPAGAVARAATPGTVTQGIAQALASQPKTQLAAGAIGGGTAGATDNPVLGLAAGLATPLGVAAARRAISPVNNRLSPQETSIAKFAGKEGVPLTPSQSTGSPVLRGLEETMARLPLSNGPMQDAYAGQRAAFNRSVLSRAGVTADDASPETMQNAFRQAGQTFDDLASRTTIAPDAQFAKDIAQVDTNYGRRLPTDVKPVFDSYMQDLQPLLRAVRRGLNPQIDGNTYATIRSDLATRIRESQNNPPLRRALGGLVSAMDDVMERSTSGALRQEWQTARREYQALMTVDKAMQGGTQADRSSGNIPFSGLKAATVQSDKAGFARGRGQMNEPARLGDFLATRVPNSGTPERMFYANLLTGGSLFGGGLAAGGGPTLAGLASGAAATAAPWAISKAYNSPLIRAYLTNQAAGRSQLGPLYAAQGLERAIETIPQDQPSALARALMKANEKRAAR